MVLQNGNWGYFTPIQAYTYYTWSYFTLPITGFTFFFFPLGRFPFKSREVGAGIPHANDTNASAPGRQVKQATKKQSRNGGCKLTLTWPMANLLNFLGLHI